MTIYDLYKFDHYILSGSKEILAANGITASYAQMDNGNLGTPRVELQSVVGAPTGHCKLSGSKAYHDSWNATLNVIVVTDRGSNASFNTEFTSKVISLLGDYSNFNSGSILPYHTVLRSDYNGSSPSIEAEGNKDISGLTFVLSVWVKPTSWP